MAPSIHRLNLATVNLPGKYNPPSFADTRINVYAYLVVAPADVILIDTGVGEGNGYIERTFEPHTASIAAELDRHGVGISDVTIVVNSHLHFDHCGNNQLFPHARIFVQNRELEIARTPGYTVREWFDYPGASHVAVTGDFEISPSVTLLATPGHTPGHQSVLITAGKADVVVAAQAAFTADEYLRGGDPKQQAHEGYAQPYVASISKLKSLSAETAYFSHDDRTAPA